MWFFAFLLIPNLLVFAYFTKFKVLMIISSFFKSRLKHDGQIRLLLLFNVLYTVLDVSSLEIPYYTLCWMLHLLKSLISLSHTLGLSPLGYMWFDLALVSCCSLKYDVNVALLTILVRNTYPHFITIVYCFSNTT